MILYELEIRFFDGDVRWWKIGVGDEHIDNPIVFWMPLPKSPHACH